MRGFGACEPGQGRGRENDARTPVSYRWYKMPAQPFRDAVLTLENTLGHSVTSADLAWALGSAPEWIDTLSRAEAQNVRPAWVLAVKWLAREGIEPNDAAEIEVRCEDFRTRANALPMLRKQVALHLGITQTFLRNTESHHTAHLRRFYFAVCELNARFADVRTHVATYASHNLASML